MSYHAEIAADGSLPLPVELASALGIKPGDRVSLDHSDGGLVVRREDGREAAVIRLRAALKGYSVDQFLAERSADWGE